MRLPRNASPGLCGAWLTTLAQGWCVRSRGAGPRRSASVSECFCPVDWLRWVRAEGICGGREGALQLPRSERVKICRLSGKLACLLRALVALTEDPNNLPQLQPQGI